ncbi:MAG: MerR family transcriptional regulator [Actinomycetales bacterium]|nr:MerR family transcriptional regulator [Actinomycetales bacterium]
MPEASLRIGEVARRSGLTVRTLRHYDDLGLLVPSDRTHGDHRLYSAEDVRRLLAVQQLRSLGLSLAEVGAALDDPAFDAADTLAAHIALVEQRLAAEHELLGRLRSLRDAADSGWEEVLALVALTERLGHRESAVRLRAALDAPTAAPLALLVANLAAEPDPAVQDVLAWAVVQQGPDAVPLVVEHLVEPDPAVRVRMSIVLAKLADARAVPALVGLLDDADREVVSSAAFALGRIGGPDALAALVGRLGRDPDSGRDSLGDAIACFGEQAVGPLTEALAAGDRDVREHAAEVLGFVAGAGSAPALAAALADADPGVRLAALLALGRLEGEQADAAIRGAAASEEPRIRALALRLTADRTPPPAGRSR